MGRCPSGTSQKPHSRHLCNWSWWRCAPYVNWGARVPIQLQSRSLHCHGLNHAQTRLKLKEEQARTCPRNDHRRWLLEELLLSNWVLEKGLRIAVETGPSNICIDSNPVTSRAPSRWNWLRKWRWGILVITKTLWSILTNSTWSRNRALIGT